MNAAVVPYRSARPMRGRARPTRTLSGLAGSPNKRNWSAFDSANPGTTVNASGNYVLPAKFANAVINQGQLDELAGTWYGATFHPDGDQEGWHQKFDAALKKIGAYNAYYNIVASPPPTGLIPPPVLTIAPTPSPSPTPAPSPSPTATTLPATGTTPAITVNVPATVPPDNTTALIQQLMAQGASQQQAFAQAMQSLAAQGIQPTPQVQQQVANDVANAANPQQASVMYLALGAVAIIGIGIFMSRGKKQR